MIRKMENKMLLFSERSSLKKSVTLCAHVCSCLSLWLSLDFMTGGKRYVEFALVLTLAE